MAAARDADRFERVAAEQRYAFPAHTHTTTILVSCSQPTVSLRFLSDSALPASVSYVSGAAAEPSASRRKLRVWTPMTSLHDPLMTRVGAVHLISSLLSAHAGFTTPTPPWTRGRGARSGGWRRRRRRWRRRWSRWPTSSTPSKAKCSTTRRPRARWVPPPPPSLGLVVVVVRAAAQGRSDPH